MKRVDFPAEGSGSDRLREILESRPPLNLYRMLPRAGVLAEHFLMMGGAIRNDLSLDPKIRELAIVRVGLMTGAAYEVHHHKHIARSVGATEQELAAVIEGAYQSFEPQISAALLYTDAVCTEVRASDDAFRSAKEALGIDHVAQLTMVVGYYLMAASFLRNFDIKIEDHLDHSRWL